MFKMRSQPLHLKISFIAICIAAILMIVFYRNESGIFNFKNLFLLTWIAVMIIGFFSGLKRWIKYANVYIKKKAYFSVVVHFAVLIFILYILISMTIGLTKALFNSI